MFSLGWSEYRRKRYTISFWRSQDTAGERGRPSPSRFAGPFLSPLAARELGREAAALGAARARARRLRRTNRFIVGPCPRAKGRSRPDLDPRACRSVPCLHLAAALAAARRRCRLSGHGGVVGLFEVAAVVAAAASG